MGYDRGDSFPFDFEPNGITFDSKSKGKLSPRPYPIQCERNWKYSFLSESLATLGGSSVAREPNSSWHNGDQIEGALIPLGTILT